MSFLARMERDLLGESPEHRRIRIALFGACSNPEKEEVRVAYELHREEYDSLCDAIRAVQVDVDTAACEQVATSLLWEEHPDEHAALRARLDRRVAQNPYRMPISDAVLRAVIEPPITDAADVRNSLLALLSWLDEQDSSDEYRARVHKLYHHVEVDNVAAYVMLFHESFGVVLAVGDAVVVVMEGCEQDLDEDDERDDRLVVCWPMGSTAPDGHEEMRHMWVLDRGFRRLPRPLYCVDMGSTDDHLFRRPVEGLQWMFDLHP